MSATAHGHPEAPGHVHGHGHTAHEHHEPNWFFKYVFSTDHKQIGRQFMFTTLAWLFVGGLLALIVRWQLGFPGQDVPIVGGLLDAWYGTHGKVDGNAYNMAFTMHASVMIFLVIIPMLVGAFGNFCVPLMIGARDMAFPLLNALSYWFMWPAMALFGASFFVEGGAASSGWTAYPPLSYLGGSMPGAGQTLWSTGVFFVGASSIMGAINYITTIVTMRAPGMKFFRMPMTVWAIFITSILGLLATPVLGSTQIMLFMDRVWGSSFFIPPGLTTSVAASTPNAYDYSSGGGHVILYQHLFWFYSHPAVYIMILPTMGIVSDIIATFSRKPLFGYRPMVYSIAAIAGLGFIVWGHHMFQSGMNPYLGMTFMLSTMMIALPSAIKTFNWLATLWRAQIRFTVPMCFAIAFVSMFVIGGLSGIFMAATPVDLHIHDTYFIVAHIHYVLFGGSLMGAFGGIYYWFPKMFGRHMNTALGYVHFWLTLIAFNGTFFIMHIVGLGGMQRRVQDPYARYPYIDAMLPENRFMTISAIVLGFVQLIFMGNFLWSVLRGRKAEQNPWQANTLEWTAAPTPTIHGNFAGRVPRVFRGPYEYSSPEVAEDWLPQDKDLGSAPATAPAH
jgi:cytochrome c oxidase subunit I